MFLAFVMVYIEIQTNQEDLSLKVVKTIAVTYQKKMLNKFYTGIKYYIE